MQIQYINRIFTSKHRRLQ